MITRRKRQSSTARRVVCMEVYAQNHATPPMPMTIAETQAQPKVPSDARSRIFPMHLTPFEQYMLVDDRMAYPMTFVVEYEFSGKVRRQEFEPAVEAALERHPLLQAIIQPAKQNRDCWVYGRGLKPQIDWGELDEPIRLEDGDFIDLRNEIGLRIWIRQSDTRAIITTQFHHAVCDGIGSYQFMGDVFWFYADATGDDELEELQKLDPKKIRERGRASFDASRFMDGNGKFKMEWGETARMFLRRIAPLKKNRASRNEDPACFPGIESVAIDKQEYHLIRLAAQRSCQTPNDYLLEKLLLTLAQWNDRRRRLPGLAKLGIMLPLDLREPGNGFPAANFLSYAFIQRRTGQLKNRQRLVKSLCEEISILKRDRKHSSFLNMIAGGQFYPKILKRMLSANRCLGTAILSNTGDPTKQFLTRLPRLDGAVKCGNLVLESIIGVPPIRPRTHATISIFTYRRELRICIRLDPLRFSESDTRELLENYVRQIRKGAADQE